MKVKLGDLYPITSGGTPSRKHTEYYTGGTIPWVKTGDLKDKYLFKTEENITDIGLKNSSAKLYPEDTVLLAMYGATIGAVSILKKEAATNQACAAFIRHDDILPEYLYAFLESQKNKFVREAVGGAQPNISATYLKRIYIPLLSLDEQCRIAAILDKVSDLIALRKKQLAKLDELVKARFVEMFGDEKKFSSTQLHNNVEEMFIGPFGSSLKNDCFVSKEQSFCMVYEQKHAIYKTLDVETRYVNEKKFQELKRFAVCGGDIIVSCRGTIGETFIVPEFAPIGIMHPSIMKIRLKMNVYNKVFFNHLLQNVLKKYNDKVNGSSVKMAITAKTLGKQKLILPSIEFQQKFANFVEAIDKQKAKIEKSLEKLEILKKSLMQEYFG